MRSRLLDLSPVHRRLFAALGLSPLALAGCGGLVVFVEDGEGGGGSSTDVATVGPTATSASSSKASSSSSGDFTCTTPGVTYACNFDAVGLCPPAGSSQAIGLMNAVLSSSWECDEWCWCETYVTEVPCGPDPAAEAGCCYYAITQTDEICMGRPFTIDAAARLAPLAARADWSTSIVVDAAALGDRARRGLAAAFRRDGVFEHASVASFARFALELLALGAPADLVRRAQAAMRDEIRHAELCFGVATALDGEAVGPGPLAIDGSLAGRSDAATILSAVIAEGCVGETLSALIALAARDAATDPGVKAALAEIAADELAHAELAWATIAWARSSGAPEWVAAIDAALERVAPISVDDDGPLASPEVARAFGRLSKRERAAIADRGFAAIVQPLAAALTRNPGSAEQPAHADVKLAFDHAHHALELPT